MDAPTRHGFDRPRSVADPLITQQYEALGLGPTPSVYDLEPTAIEMLTQHQLVEAIGLVLGRTITAADIDADPQLGIIRDLGHQPALAFNGLLFKVLIEQASAKPS